MGEPQKYLCVECRKRVTKTKNDRYRSHTDGSGEPCKMSSDVIPEHVLAGESGLGKVADDVPQEGIDFASCPDCGRKVKLTKLGYFEPHDRTLRGGDRCEHSGVRLRTVTDVVPDLPAEIPSPESTTTPEPSPESTEPSNTSSSDSEDPTTSTADGSGEADAAAPTVSPELAAQSTLFSQPGELRAERAGFGGRTGMIYQPDSPFVQPGEIPVRVKAEEAMDDLGRQIATQFRTLFHQYANRMPRNQQTTLGPSEIGDPCDRKLAMALMRIPPVSPGNDGWAAFVGTQVHEGLANMFEWADAGTGRYATEVRLKFPTVLVPKGTTDLIDRVLYMIDDHKIMGKYSLKKLIEQGPSDTYRVQAHTYGYGAELAGEKVKHVAIIGWPREASSLNDLYVWTEPYDRSVAEEALARVDRIWADVEGRSHGLETVNKLEIAKTFSINRGSCDYCPFHMPKDKEMTKGCPGR